MMKRDGSPARGELESTLAAATEVLTAIASGRFDVRAPRLGDGSAADTLAFLVNATAEEVEHLVSEVEREHKQLERAHEHLLQSAKLAALGHLAGGIAHELNQPLTVIQMVTDLLREQGDAKIADRRADLDLVHGAARDMARIVGSVRMFARPSAFELVRTPPLVPLEDALLLVGEDLKQLGIAIMRHIAGDLPCVSGDPERLKQVFVNLLTNARDALRDTPDATRREISIALHGADGCAEYAIADNGSGVAPQHAERIFDPFFTTKPVGQGTGLGLSVALGIVRDHGGELRHEQVPGGGARFVVRIPVAGAEVEP
jgi:C4-dicarboxylate-specific signal transduction histidine kinase